MARTRIGLEPVEVDLVVLGRDMTKAEHARVSAFMQRHAASDDRAIKAYDARKAQAKVSREFDPDALYFVNRSRTKEEEEFTSALIRLTSATWRKRLGAVQVAALRKRTKVLERLVAAQTPKPYSVAEDVLLVAREPAPTYRRTKKKAK